MQTARKQRQRASAMAKREAIAAVFGDVPVDSENMNFLYHRRHLAIVRDRRWNELKYIVDFDNLEHAISKTLDRILARDGRKIFEEVAERLISSINEAIDRRRPRRCR